MNNYRFYAMRGDFLALKLTGGRELLHLGVNSKVSPGDTLVVEKRHGYQDFRFSPWKEVYRKTRIGKNLVFRMKIEGGNQ